MPNFVVFKPDTGEILRSGFCMDDALIFQARDGEAVIECDFSVKYGTHYVNPVNREPMAIPEKPTPHHRWDWESYSWQEDLSVAKKAKATEISKACRDLILSGFDSDALGAPYHYPAKELDQQNLLACVTDSLYPDLPANWTTKFWCVDSAGVWEFRPHTAVQIQQVGCEGKAIIMAAMDKNEQLQTQVALSNSIEAINQIIW